MKESDFDSALGRRIQRHRKARRFSQVELGKRLDISRSSIANIENGFHKPSVFQIYKICMALNLPLEEVLLPLDDMKKTENVHNVYEKLKNNITFGKGRNVL